MNDFTIDRINIDFVRGRPVWADNNRWPKVTWLDSQPSATDHMSQLLEHWRHHVPNEER